MKYLKIQQQQDIPSNAERLFAQNETFQMIGDNLELIVGWYNEAGSEGETTQLLFRLKGTGEVWVPQAHHLRSLPILWLSQAMAAAVHLLLPTTVLVGWGPCSSVLSKDMLAQVKQHSPVGVLAQVKQQLMPVEQPLLAKELEAVDNRLASAEKSLFWSHEGANSHLGHPRLGILLVHFEGPWSPTQSDLPLPWGCLHNVLMCPFPFQVSWNTSRR